MSEELKPLEALEITRATLRCWNDEDETAEDAVNQELDIIETALKALDIIKKKKVDTVELFICFNIYDDLETFNMSVNYANGELALTQEEFNILKECFK